MRHGRAAVMAFLHKDSKIVIVGAGVFGLSTTLHLLERGYRNLRIFDSQPLHQTHYRPEKGAIGASCDNNYGKIQYGGSPGQIRDPGIPTQNFATRNSIQLSGQVRLVLLDGSNEMERCALCADSGAACAGALCVRRAAECAG